VLYGMIRRTAVGGYYFAIHKLSSWSQIAFKNDIVCIKYNYTVEIIITSIAYTIYCLQQAICSFRMHIRLYVKYTFATSMGIKSFQLYQVK